MIALHLVNDYEAIHQRKVGNLMTSKSFLLFDDRSDDMPDFDTGTGTVAVGASQTYVKRDYRGQSQDYDIEILTEIAQNRTVKKRCTKKGFDFKCEAKINPRSKVRTLVTRVFRAGTNFVVAIERFP